MKMNSENKVFERIWDPPLHCKFQCSNGVISGVESTNSNHDEDRVWNFRCCSQPNMCHTECSTSSYVNDYDDPLSWVVTPGYFLVGANSVHNDHHEYVMFNYVDY